MRARALAMSLMLAVWVAAEQPEPEVVATWGGDDVYQGLPLGAIPAIASATTTGSGLIGGASVLEGDLVGQGPPYGGIPLETRRTRGTTERPRSS